MTTFAVATQIKREKVNFTLSFPEARPRMSQVLARANAAFSEYTGTEFSCCLGMVFNASKQYWSPLEHTAQLVSGAQIYLFQPDVHEVPGVIPDARPGDYLLANYAPSRGGSASPASALSVTRGPTIRVGGRSVSPRPYAPPVDSPGAASLPPRQSVSAVPIADYNPAACPTATTRNYALHNYNSHNSSNYATHNPVVYHGPVNPCSPFNRNDPSTFGQGPRVHQNLSNAPSAMYSSSSSEPRASAQRFWASNSKSQTSSSIGGGYRYKQGGRSAAGGALVDPQQNDPYVHRPLAGDSICRAELQKEAWLLNPARPLDSHRASVRSETHNFVASRASSQGERRRSSTASIGTPSSSMRSSSASHYLSYGSSSSNGGAVGSARHGGVASAAAPTTRYDAVTSYRTNPSARLLKTSTTSAYGYPVHSPFSSSRGHGVLAPSAIGKSSRTASSTITPSYYRAPTTAAAATKYHHHHHPRFYSPVVTTHPGIRALPPAFLSSIQRNELIKENNVLHPSLTLEAHRGVTRHETQAFVARNSPIRIRDALKKF